MDPSIGSKLNTFDHRLRLMYSAWVLLQQVVGSGARPKHRGALARLHLEVELREGGLSAFLHVREVQEERQDTYGDHMVASIVVCTSQNNQTYQLNPQ